MSDMKLLDAKGNLVTSELMTYGKSRSLKQLLSSSDLKNVVPWSAEHERSIQTID